MQKYDLRSDGSMTVTLPSDLAADLLSFVNVDECAEFVADAVRDSLKWWLAADAEDDAACKQFWTEFFDDAMAFAMERVPAVADAKAQNEAALKAGTLVGTEMVIIMLADAVGADVSAFISASNIVREAAARVGSDDMNRRFVALGIESEVNSAIFGVTNWAREDARRLFINRRRNAAARKP